jgi:integrase/recombinase XerD
MNPRENLLELFAADQALRNIAPKTVYNLCREVSNYLRWAKDEGKDPIKVDLRLYLKTLKEKGLKGPTIRTTFSRINVFFTFLEEEGIILKNPIPRIQKTYLNDYKTPVKIRKALTIEQATELIGMTTRSRDKAVLLLLLKTGIRRHELVNLDVDSVDIDSLSLTLKETHKRSNRLVFFDDETAQVLRRWLKSRELRFKKEKDEPALFLNNFGTRLGDNGIDNLVGNAIQRVNEAGRVGQISFVPHQGRYCFTTWLLNAGMSIRYVKWLRGDALKEAYEIYDTIRPDEVKKSYLACIPQLGI